MKIIQYINLNNLIGPKKNKNKNKISTPKHKRMRLFKCEFLLKRYIWNNQFKAPILTISLAHYTVFSTLRHKPIPHAPYILCAFFTLILAIYPMPLINLWQILTIYFNLVIFLRDFFLGHKFHIKKKKKTPKTSIVERKKKLLEKKV